MQERDRIITADEVAGSPRHTGRYWFDFAAASAAIFISVVSLVIGTRGEATQRDLLAANAWPFIELDEERNFNATDSSVLIRIRNEGAGPAKVVSFEEFYANHPVDNVTDLFRQCCAGLPTQKAHCAPAWASAWETLPATSSASTRAS